MVVAIIEDPYLPLGTLIAWFSLVSLAILPWLTSASLRAGQTMFFLVLRNVTFLAAGLAPSWPFVGRLLAGNWHYSFSGAITEFTGSAEAGFYYWRYTGLVVMLPLVVFILVWGQYLIKKL